MVTDDVKEEPAMGKENGLDIDVTEKERREFLKKVGTAAAAAPAVALLLSASSVPATAGPPYGQVLR